jgi:hypothetical protein
MHHVSLALLHCRKHSTMLILRYQAPATCSKKRQHDSHMILAALSVA